MSVERAREQLELAEGRWQTAVKEHAQPPPDAGYTRRLRALADAAAQEQAAYRYAEEQGFGWRPGPAWLPPQELRDAPWRSALAPDGRVGAVRRRRSVPQPRADRRERRRDRAGVRTAIRRGMGSR